MEGFLVSASSGALKAVTVKLATLLGDEFKHIKDVHKEIKPLSDELNCIHAFLERTSEGENPADQDKVWMADVREMCYDIEDSLDEFMVYLNRDKSAKPKGLMKKCKKLVNKMKAQQRISKAIQDCKTYIKEVAERNQRYRTGVMGVKGTNEMVDIRALAIFKDTSELVGIDGPKDELINLLIGDGSSSQRQVKVVAIVGSGGLGKTTIANQVYESLKDRFDCRSFVTVSRNPDMMNVLRTILSDITGQDYTDTRAGDVQHLIRKISNFLLDKRYFIVVDDLWDSESWEIINYAFIKNSCGCTIITTTRVNDVARSCSTSHQGHIYKLCPLNDEDSRELFLKRIFGSKDGCPSQLTKVSDDILKKCGGLPLAIISIAGLLASKAPTFDEWSRVQSSFGYALERQYDVNRMIRILSLSYFDLPPHLRSCLLYLSVFPEDHEITKDRLVLRWIAEGFIHDEPGFTQYELGEMCLNELINRSLIEPVVFDFLGTLILCRVHDIVLEFIVSKAMEENFVTLFGVPNTICDSRRKIRRLSLQDRNEEVDDGVVGLREKMIYSHTRAVSVFTRNLDNLPSLQELRYVRVLDLEGCMELQDHHLAHIGGLFALRYLGLRRTWIHQLPEEIEELRSLQTLDVRFTSLKKLSSSVCLSWLANLLCDDGVRMPDGFRNMQALQRLVTIDPSRQLPGFSHELCQLRNLRMLKIKANEFTKDVVSSISTLGAGSLNSLIISTREASMNFIMEPWSPTPLSLRVLEIWWCIIPMVPRWIGLLDNLRRLLLYVEQLGSADIDLLGGLNALSCLFLCVSNEVANRSSSSEEPKPVKIRSAQGFPSLVKFRVGSWRCGFGLFFEAGAMPRLQELHLEFDTDKTGSLTNGEFDFGIQHLPCLAIVKCNLGYYWDRVPEDDPAWGALKVAVSSNPNRPRLHHTYK